MKYEMDDMDELFRRAAESYPLDVNSSNWDKLAGVLHTDAGKDDKKPGLSLRKLLWVLVLLPLPFICNHTDWAKTHYAAVTTEGMRGGKAGGDAGTPARNEMQRRGTPNRQIPARVGRDVTTVAQAKAHATSGPSIYTADIHFFKTSRHPTRKNVARQTARLGQATSLGNTAPIAERSLENDLKLRSNSGSALAYQWRNGFNVTLAVPAAMAHKTVAAVTTAERVPGARQRKREFYSGLVANFGWSSVKSQWSSRPDNSLGLMFGLQWSQRWAVEGGVNVDKKYYVSEGKYFKGYVPWPSTSIKSVDGNCFMFEFPMDVRFNFINGQRANWFVSSGLTSYLMKKEAYTYYVQYSNGVTGEHYYEYKNATRNWFAIYQASIGYQRPMSKFASLRVEPFVKLPLTGLGVGKLPFVSAGLQLGLVHKF